MRIAGHIEHPTLKITILQMNDRFAVKFEDGVCEQVYKLRTGPGVESVEDVKSMIDQEFVNKVQFRFMEMQDSLSRVLKGASEEGLDEII